MSKLIFFPVFYTEISTDVLKQTINSLNKLGYESIIILFNDTGNLSVIKKLLHYENIKFESKNNEWNYHQYSYVDILPFVRFQFIKNLNYYLFFIIIILISLVRHKRNIFKISLVLWILQYSDIRLIKITNLFHFCLYDCTDYIENKRNLVSKKHLQPIFSKVNHCFFNSITLRDLYGSNLKNYTVIPQGFRAQSFIKKTFKKAKNMEIKIGYIGGLNDRIDYRLLNTLIKKNPQYKFELWGPVIISIHDAFDVNNEVNKLKKYQNVLISKTSKKNIPKVISSFDIAIIPYDANNKFNKYCFPMKIMEYFYVGTPIISTPIDEQKYYESFVHIATTVKEWEKTIHLVSKKNYDWNIPTKRKISLNNSWDNKILAIDSVLNASL